MSDQRCAVSGLPAGDIDACGDCDPCIHALAERAVDRAFKKCTCHPDDRPPYPCPQKFAYSECVAASSQQSLTEKP